MSRFWGVPISYFPQYVGRVQWSPCRGLRIVPIAYEGYSGRPAGGLGVSPMFHFPCRLEGVQGSPCRGFGGVPQSSSIP